MESSGEKLIIAPSRAVFVVQRQEAEIMAQGRGKEVHKEVGVDEVMQDVLHYTSNLVRMEEMPLKIVAANRLQSREAVLQKPTVSSVEVICLTTANLEGMCYKIVGNSLALDSQYTMHYTSRLEYKMIGAESMYAVGI